MTYQKSTLVAVLVMAILLTIGCDTVGTVEEPDPPLEPLEVYNQNDADDILYMGNDPDPVLKIVSHEGGFTVTYDIEGNREETFPPIIIQDEKSERTVSFFVTRFEAVPDCESSNGKVSYFWEPGATVHDNVVERINNHQMGKKSCDE